MNPRILILTASVGAGHNRAAQAIELALREICPQATIRNVDVLDLTNPGFRRFYGKTYFDVVARAPHLVGYLYDRLDRPMGQFERMFDKLRFGFQQLNLRRVTDLLTEDHWDLAISTHFLPAEIIGFLRQSGRIDLPQATVTTDFDTHRMWCNTPCEHYFTATEEGRTNLAAWGIPPSRITATGIPVHPLFARQRNVWESRRRLDIRDDRTVVLQLAGGLGVGPIEKIHRQLLATELPLQLVVVTGRNTRARGLLEAIQCPGRHQRTILGYTDKMDELMAVADVIVSKPGGLTTSEALCRGAAMIIVDPIPGQESRNSDFLLENGAAVKVNNLAALSQKLTALLTEPGRLDAIRASARRLARPRAAFEIADRAVKLIEPAKGLTVRGTEVSMVRRSFWRNRRLLTPSKM